MIKLPKHYRGLRLVHNEHKSLLKPLALAILDHRQFDSGWISPAQRASALARDEVWTLSWDSGSRGSYKLYHAADLDALLEFCQDL